MKNLRFIVYPLSLDSKSSPFATSSAIACLDIIVTTGLLVSFLDLLMVWRTAVVLDTSLITSKLLHETPSSSNTSVTIFLV